MELKEALASLNERMRHVLELRFGLNGQVPRTLEVGAELGVTRERVRQLESAHSASCKPSRPSCACTSAPSSVAPRTGR